MTQPTLLILSFSNLASDARVLKQIKYFADRYEVTTYGYGPSPDPRVRHVRLDETKGIRRWRRLDLILRRFDHIYWNQPAVRQAEADLASLGRFDMILANDIDTIGLALSLDPVRGVHADIHEYAPRQNEELLIWRVFIAPYVRWMCRRHLPRAASMTTVAQGIADEYSREFAVDADVVTNASPYAELAPSAVRTPIRLVHSGASIRNRRLEVMIDAVSATTAEVTLDLYLMGNDPGYIAELQGRAAGSPRIRFPEPLPYEELITRLNEYDVGVPLIPPTNFNNRCALPNKFFDYVQARLGVIIGPSAEMRHVLERYHLGAVADDFTAAALTRTLDALTVEQVNEWKSAAVDAAHALSAETQAKAWANAIEALTEMNLARPTRDR